MDHPEQATPEQTTPEQVTPEQMGRPTPEGAAAGSSGVRREEQAEIAAENRQSSVEGSDDYLRRNSQGPKAAEAAIGKPAPVDDGAVARPGSKPA